MRVTARTELGSIGRNPIGHEACTNLGPIGHVMIGTCVPILTSTPIRGVTGVVSRSCPDVPISVVDMPTWPASSSPVVATADGVLLRGAALPVMYRATLALIARRSRDGLSASPLLHEARTTLYRACMSPPRHEGGDTHPLVESRSAGEVWHVTRNLV